MCLLLQDTAQLFNKWNNGMRKFKVIGDRKQMPNSRKIPICTVINCGSDCTTRRMYAYGGVTAGVEISNHGPAAE